jgi:hypothetical protein
VERLIAEIGAVDAAVPPEDGISLGPIACAYPDFGAAGRWFEAFTSSLDAWLAGDDAAVPVLGTATPVKRWLAGLLALRLEIYGTWAKYIAGSPAGRSGDLLID